MIIFKNNIMRIFKDRANFIFMVMIPIIIIIFILIFSVGEDRFNLGLADNDKTFLTNYIIKSFDDKVNIIYADENQIKNLIVSEKIDYSLVIEKGTTNKIINGEVPKIKTYRLKDSEATILFENYINTIVSDLYNIGKTVNGDIDEYKNIFKIYTQKNMELIITLYQD
ncbi:ABC transporter permease [Caloramator sp. mosi_1]|uniref:ABC transporter permease n=1 Tax=Caloramator sp. mosi_1 TaxID=3023090 RepID=UPI00235F7DBB|nr:ABC transporter permease [Caloramator sp. mosi_1]WDC83462.1 ABC transporter permease [Caloramator sp. mosi_1]